MRHRPVRHRLGLLLVIAGLSLIFVWDSVYGQGFRPRIPIMPRPPIGGGLEFIYTFTCQNCLKEAGRGKSPLDCPPSCPHCGVRFINGGIGTGSPPANNPGMMPGMNPPTNPVMPPISTNPPPLNPIGSMPPQNQIPPQNPVTAAPQMPVSTPAASEPLPASARSPWLIPGIIGIVLLGVLGLGGVWMMIASLKGEEAPPRKARSRRSRRDDDDYDD